MQISSFLAEELPQVAADAIVVSVWDKNDDGALELGPLADQINQLTSGLLKRLIDDGEVSTKSLACTRVYEPTGLRAKSLLVVGLGKPEAAEPGLAFRAAGAAAKTLADKQRRTVLFALDLEPQDELVAGAMVGSLGQDLYRKQRTLFPFESLMIVDGDPNLLMRGHVLGDAVNLTRRLVNAPANEIYPESFADICVEQGERCGFEVEVWDRERLEQENCGSLLAVAQGSAREPRLVIMRYQGAPLDHAPVGLVGKGVTFDSGGLSLKPSESMLDMKCDMAGAATVLGAMTALAQLQTPANVVGLVGLVENMISGTSYRLGDVIQARNGKTIEVHNTDAEGRMVLADVLDVALECDAQRLIDLATLTGACMVALGRSVAGGMTNDESWYADIAAAAKQCGEPIWQLPMFAEYGEHIRSSVADIKNVGDGRWGGAITAAKFLEEFVGNRPWVHIDIAGPSFNDKAPPWVDAGASGCFVRTIVQAIENLA
ncbi:MAG: leucyl aminopeptidase [Pirellulaceae bacterium]|nr:leucyl aminopeptidase [Pirellulaceae bacterium]